MADRIFWVGWIAFLGIAGGVGCAKPVMETATCTTDGAEALYAAAAEIAGVAAKYGIRLQPVRQICWQDFAGTVGEIKNNKTGLEMIPSGMCFRDGSVAVDLAARGNPNAIEEILTHELGHCAAGIEHRFDSEVHMLAFVGPRGGLERQRCKVDIMDYGPTCEWEVFREDYIRSLLPEYKVQSKIELPDGNSEAAQEFYPFFSFTAQR